MTTKQSQDNTGPSDLGAVGGQPVRPDLNSPRVVLALLESDQVVAEKRRTRFGRRKLSLGLRALLWSLRVYVVLMLVIVVIAVLHALHASR